ncbi:MAG TPA: type I-C CRISPR-associated protein Cas5c [Smithellaceae bacterium]|jgi:CRISPR-associated protein Cas5d|nr:type I-C CRISPR-associated protein Cas5c [Alphaproteobacteria bacterium]HQQ88349.1 type I-C CRISPR-associated protein Cas5c [Smithellaceae bacterium]
MNDKKMRSKTFYLKVWGDNACFTRPEMKVERVSYDVMTPSAARGVLEAILWKPAIAWHIERIDVLNPISWESVRRNEVGARMSPRSDGLFVDDPRIRQQRAGLFLRKVAYVIHAYFIITEKAGAEDNITKFQEMFARRVQKGQCFNRPYLGCREFSSHFELLPDEASLPETIPDTLDLGWMLYDMCHDASQDNGNHVHTCTEKCHPSFFRAHLVKGVIDLAKAEVRS